jgi:hypothetical protein
LIPIGYDPTPADDVVGFDLKQIGKVAANSNFQIELDGVATVIDQIQVLMHPSLIQGATDQQP